MTTNTLQPKPRPPRQMLRHRWFRLALSMTIALAALLSTTVAWAQNSANYDLACRAFISGGGGTIANRQYGVTAAFGVPFALQDATPDYALKGGSFGLRSAFLPGYPAAPRATAAQVTAPDQPYVQRLPILFKMVYVIRGC